MNKGAHSIAVFGEDNKAKHLFDITQTNGKRVGEQKWLYINGTIAFESAVKFQQE